MARYHILGRSGLNRYTVVVHSPTPAGNNQAGVSWATVLVNSGKAALGSELIVGSGPGRISNAENNQIIAGTVFESKMDWEDPVPGQTGAAANTARQNDLETRAAQSVTQAVALFQEQNLFWGHEFS